MVASQDASSAIGVGAPGRSGSRGLLRAKLLVAGLIVLALLGVFCASLLREATTTSRTACRGRSAGLDPRPNSTTASWTIPAARASSDKGRS